MRSPSPLLGPLSHSVSADVWTVRQSSDYNYAFPFMEQKFIQKRSHSLDIALQSFSTRKAKEKANMGTTDDIINTFMSANKSGNTKLEVK